MKPSYDVTIGDSLRSDPCDFRLGVCLAKVVPAQDTFNMPVRERRPGVGVIHHVTARLVENLMINIVRGAKSRAGIAGGRLNKNLFEWRLKQKLCR